jgi:hypothetical protein
MSQVKIGQTVNFLDSTWNVLDIKTLEDIKRDMPNQLSIIEKMEEEELEVLLLSEVKDHPLSSAIIKFHAAPRQTAVYRDKEGNLTLC